MLSGQIRLLRHVPIQPIPPERHVPRQIRLLRHVSDPPVRSVRHVADRRLAQAVRFRRTAKAGLAHGGARHPAETGNPTLRSARRGVLRLTELHRVACAAGHRITPGVAARAGHCRPSASPRPPRNDSPAHLLRCVKVRVSQVRKSSCLLTQPIPLERHVPRKIRLPRHVGSSRPRYCDMFAGRHG